jgi:hypothetical protein
MADATKLGQDVESINQSIQVYMSSGGSLTSATTADAVLAKLKTPGGSTKTLGVTSSVIDARLWADSGDSTTSRLRARLIPSSDPAVAPRFVLEQGKAGVVEFRLDESLAATPTAADATSRTGAKDLATSGGWVWDKAQPNDVAIAPGGTPGATASTPSTLGATTITQLSPPTFSPSGGTLSLSAFAAPGLSVTISSSNPGGASQIYYSIGGGGYTLYSAGLSLPPGLISAVAVSLDPSRYSTSTTASATYLAKPTLTWSGPTAMTWADLSNATLNTASVSADGTGSFAIHYTTNGSDPDTSSPTYSSAIPLTSGLWASSSLTLKAKAISSDPLLYEDSAVATLTVTATATQLTAPTIFPASQIVSGAQSVTITKAAADPAGTLLYYATNGTALTTATGTLYSGPFAIPYPGMNQSNNVKAIATGPAGSGLWFTTSSEASVTYSGLNFDFANLNGVLIGGGRIENNATLNGSVVLISVGGIQPNVTFDNNSALSGHIYAPGTPAVVGIDASRVINLDGAESPDNYTITINKADFTGNVYRRITPVTMPTVTLPTGLAERGAASPGVLLPGHYTNINGGNGGTFTLGHAGDTTPTIYVVDNLTVGNNAYINIVGPVIITMNPGSGTTINISNNAVVGNSAHADWLRINMYSGNLYVGNNGALYGSVLAPTGIVTFDNNSAFQGGVTAKYLNIMNNAAGLIFNLPPPS